MDTKKLRQKILDLAIRGKLVPQDPNDEPASLLLERIRAEKERLIKEGKIKRSKKTADNARFNNINFVIPPNWALSTLAEVFYMHAGKSIAASQISSKKVDEFSYQCIGGNGTRGYVKTYNTQGIHPIIGRQGALCGNINYASGHFYATEHAVVVDTFCNTSERWVYYILINLNLNQYATATAQPGLSVNTIGDVQIPIPPINEQKRIVEAIERWFTLIDELESNEGDLLKAIDKAKSQILDLAIHGKLVPQDPNDEPAIELLKHINPKFEPYDEENYEGIPDTWYTTHLGNICFLTEGEAIADREYPYIDVKGIRTGSFTTKQSGKHIKQGTTLILVDGENSGEVFRTPIDGYQGSTLKILNINKNVNSKYILLFIRLNQKALRENKVGSAIPHLNKKMFRELTIPIPPYQEQLRIVSKIEELFAVLDGIKESLA